MAEVYRSAASLSFSGDDLDPEEISRWLGKPTKGARKGVPCLRLQVENAFPTLVFGSSRRRRPSQGTLINRCVHYFLASAKTSASGGILPTATKDESLLGFS